MATFFEIMLAVACIFAVAQGQLPSNYGGSDDRESSWPHRAYNEFNQRQRPSNPMQVQDDDRPYSRTYPRQRPTYPTQDQGSQPEAADFMSHVSFFF